MPESLWQAVQEETAKQERKPLQHPEARQGAVPSLAQKNASENVRKDIPKKGGTSQPPEVRKSVPISERLTERRPHDLYRDQILWLKETKLEIEKRYGQLVTANAMVQLALDLLIADYDRNRERSKLVLRLVSKEAWNRRTDVRKSERTYD